MADISSIKLQNGTTYTVKDSTARKHIGNKSNPHGVTKAQVGLGNVANYDQSKAIKSITRSGTTFKATALDGTTTTFTQQDNDTTYSIATHTANGLMSAADKTKLDNLATESVSSITNAEIDTIIMSQKEGNNNGRIFR